MVDMHPPIVPEQPVPVISRDQLAALIKACTGTTFADRRDLALVRLFIDTGCRRAELTNLSVDDVDLRLRQATVTGKGRRTRTVAFGTSAPRRSTAISAPVPDTATHTSRTCGSGWPDPSPTTASRRSSVVGLATPGSTSGSTCTGSGAPTPTSRWLMASRART